jgi:ketosteroid isomerase-like protein
MDRERVQAWLDRYVEAWETYDEAVIRELFSDDVEYRYHPADEPIRGRDAVVRSWVEPEGNASDRDEPGTYTARYEPYAVDGARAVAVGESLYYSDASRHKLERAYDNCFLLEFDGDGRCRRFTELYVKRPDGD